MKGKEKVPSAFVIDVIDCTPVGYWLRNGCIISIVRHVIHTTLEFVLYHTQYIILLRFYYDVSMQITISSLVMPCLIFETSYIDTTCLRTHMVSYRNCNMLNVQVKHFRYPHRQIYDKHKVYLIKYAHGFVSKTWEMYNVKNSSCHCASKLIMKVVVNNIGNKTNTKKQHYMNLAHNSWVVACSCREIFLNIAILCPYRFHVVDWNPIAVTHLRPIADTAAGKIRVQHPLMYCNWM